MNDTINIKKIIKMKQLLSVILLSLLVSVMVSCKKDPLLEPEPEPEVEEVEEKPTLDETVEAVIPHIYIEIENGEEVVVKSTYLSATVQVEGNGKFPDLTVTQTSIKGRGNSTWGKPKKPYRLKLDKKTSILGLEPAKNWVLLANYQDYTLMTNAVAMKIGQQLGLPFTNTIIPVDLTVNGVYRGNYNLTQQIEINKGRIDIGDDGIVLELDNHYDEDFRFKSAHFQLPVMVKDPDMKSEAQFQTVQDEFQAFESLLASPGFPNNNYGDFFDKKQFVNYLIVNNLAGNFEINHPKSVYMHKTKGGKYTMGPVWDFDWGFGMDEDSRQYFNFIDLPLFKEEDPKIGAQFLSNFLRDPDVRKLYKEQWKNYRSNQFEQLLKYIEEYAASIRESKKKDFELWKDNAMWATFDANNLPKSKADFKTYLRERAKYIDKYVESL